MSKTIEVTKVIPSCDSIEYEIHDNTNLHLLKDEVVHARLQYYNAETFGFNATNLPESILSLPITLYLLPITWFYGVELVVPSIDKTLYEDLDNIHTAYSKIYGPFKPEWRGKVTAKSIVENKMPEKRYDNIVFFSGGVDAVHAGISNSGKRNVLVTVPSIEVNAVPSIQNAEAKKQEEAIRQIETELKLREAQTLDGQPEVFTVNNAGLCLLAPWFVRLFDLLGYLDKGKKQFRNTASKVRTVFLLQYLVCGEEREWRETDLAFNRLLTVLPGNVPLPQRLHLTEEERQTADGMVQGVKANWPQMDGTSVEGFRGSFLARKGTLEQEEEHWMLDVEEKAYDILLETIPWGFRQLRLPWLKKYVQVEWHEKQGF